MYPALHVHVPCTTCTLHYIVEQVYERAKQRGRQDYDNHRRCYSGLAFAWGVAGEVLVYSKVHVVQRTCSVAWGVAGEVLVKVRLPCLSLPCLGGTRI